MTQSHRTRYFTGLAPWSIGLVTGYGAHTAYSTGRGTKIVHEVNDEMRAAALPGKVIMLRVELMAIKSESEFHGKINLASA